MGSFSSKPWKEKSQEPSNQVSGQDPVEKISMSTFEKVVMRPNLLQPSDFPSLEDYDQLMTGPIEILKQEQSTVISHSLDVKGQHLELCHYAHSFDEVLDGKLKRVNEVTKVCDLNGCLSYRWQDTAYSEFWRSHRVIAHGNRGHKTCHKAWKKLWAPKLSQKELFNKVGHGPVNNMNPWFF